MLARRASAHCNSSRVESSAPSPYHLRFQFERKERKRLHHPGSQKFLLAAAGPELIKAPANISVAKHNHPASCRAHNE